MSLFSEPSEALLPSLLTRCCPKPLPEEPAMQFIGSCSKNFFSHMMPQGAWYIQRERLDTIQLKRTLLLERALPL